MPDPARLLHTIEQARLAIRNTPGRTGHVIDLTNVEDVLVAGDLHGHLGNFRSILGLADLANHPRRHLILQEMIHGPYSYMAGGDKSHQLVDLCCALKCQYPDRVHYLMGNHEMAQMTGRPVAKGDIELNSFFLEGVTSAYGSRGKEIYEAYLRLFAELPLAIRTPNRVLLSHSLPSSRHMERFSWDRLKTDDLNETDYDTAGSAYAIAWGRDASATNVATFLKLADADFLISGHIPCENGYEIPNPQQIIIDCCESPAAVCLFSADRPLTLDELKGYLRML